MFARLCLALLLVISAPLTAAQQGGCGTHGEQVPAPTSAAAEHAHHAIDDAVADHHAAAGAQSHACEDCDLACLLACAASAAASPARTLPAFQRYSPQQWERGAARRAAHRLALLRPPTAHIG